MRSFFAAGRSAVLLLSLAGFCSAASYQAAGRVRVQAVPVMGSVGAMGSGVLARPSLPSVHPVQALQWSAPAVSFSGALPVALPASVDVSVAQPSAFAPAVQQVLSPESVSAISARVFDGKAEAPPVRADLPAGPSSEAGAAPAALPEKPALGPRVLKRPVRLIITGPPGSGKGTYSQLLSREYGIPHISVGELLRAYAKNHPDVAAIMAQGRLVDTKLVLKVVRERLRQADVVERGFILDGFPRRVEEARSLKSMLGRKNVDAVIALDVPESELLRRILARGRADDNPEVFKERMRIYREDTMPAAELFRKGSTVLTPDVAGSGVETNYAGVKAQFEAWTESAGLKSRPQTPRAP